MFIVLSRLWRQAEALHETGELFLACMLVHSDAFAAHANGVSPLLILAEDHVPSDGVQIRELSLKGKRAIGLLMDRPFASMLRQNLACSLCGFAKLVHFNFE